MPRNPHQVMAIALMAISGGVLLDAGVLKAFARANAYDFTAMYRAGRGIVTGGDLYSDEGLARIAPEALAAPGVRFVYPPLSALFFVPISLLPFGVACRLWMTISLGALAVLAGILSRYWLHGLAADARWLWAGFGVLLVAAYHAVSHTLQVGQVEIVTGALALGGFELGRRQRTLAAAAVLAAGTLLKPSVALVGLFFLLKRHWPVALGWVGFVALGLALSFAVFGIEMHQRYWQYFLAHHGQRLVGVSFQDAVAFWGRLLVWEGHAPLTQYAHLAGPLTTATQVLLAIPIAALLPWRRWHELSDRRLLAELSLVFLVAIAASNLAGIHIYLLMTPGLAVTGAWLRELTGSRRFYWAMVAWAAAWSLLALPFDYRAPELQHGFLVLAISSKFYGALILWGLLTWLLARGADSPVSPDSAAGWTADHQQRSTGREGRGDDTGR
ncbi:MAG: glycosyltransferase family 87 protein [Armatimonadota bacterium]